MAVQYVSIMKTLYLSIIVVFFVVYSGTEIAYGEITPKTLANLYQEYQGKLIVLGQVMSVSENNAKNLTSYDIKILDYVTRPQQASIIIASAHTENKTIPVFDVGDNVQLYLGKGLTGYEISPYSFKMDKKCSMWLGPSRLDFEPPHSAPASSTRFLDVNGNSISPSLNHEFVLQTDGIYTPLDSIGFEVYVSLNDKPNPIFHDTKQFNVQPCTYATPTWKYTPTEAGNYTVYYKVIGGIYQDKIILDNASMTTGFTIEKSNVQSSKTTTNFIGNDLTPILSPLKQFKSGIKAENVTCKEGFERLIKGENGHPVCVKPTSVTRLLQQGWITQPYQDWNKK
ncbi:MAG: hypothetical protein KGI02_09950 [Thaumarchaeota archaeon]|nr:hypothetical protein [Nitrososphaerota archaeon]MDE1841272.1 hypothetical protein [Nitrososphaerota archaeon]MDE1877580.1 hypothetical protein [Nitrososphaerota archaeon]